MNYRIILKLDIGDYQTYWIGLYQIFDLFII